jgi:hypothetical protein
VTWQLRVKGTREPVELEPLKLSELVRLGDVDLGGVDPDLEHKRQPVRQPAAIVGPDYVPRPEGANATRLRPILLRDLPSHRVERALPELQRPGTAIPGANLVPARLTSPLQEQAVVAVQAKEDAADVDRSSVRGFRWQLPAET